MIGRELKIWRADKGLSQAAVAEKLGVSREYIARIEGGKAPSRSLAIQIESLIRDSDHAGCDNDVIMVREEGHNFSYPEGRANPLDVASNNDLKYMLSEFIKLENWGALITVAKELQHRELQAVNLQIQQMKNKREAEAG
jgi:transcriptional regulator with XRE-family HTH domain